MSETTGLVDRARGAAVAERLGRAALRWHSRLVLSQSIELWILFTMSCKVAITIPIILQGLLASISPLGNYPQIGCLDRTLAQSCSGTPAANCPVLFPGRRPQPCYISVPSTP